MMAGFEPVSPGVESDLCANCATTTAHNQLCKSYVHKLNSIKKTC